MPDDIPNFEPDSLVAGDTAAWRRTLTKYPASAGWVISYALVQQQTGLQILITGTADCDDHLINVLPAVTAAWSDGDYAGAGYCTNAATGDRFTIWRGTITIAPDLAGATPGDSRTQARRILDNINQVLEGRATQEVLEFNVEGTILRKATVADLLLLRDRYVVIVRKEEDRQKIASGRRTGRRILTRFKGVNQGQFSVMGQVGDIR
jgi:hypothetical protein